MTRRLSACLLICALTLGGCVTLPDPRIADAPSANPAQGGLAPLGPGIEGDVLVLAFSGGGARAAAFSLGVMEGLAALPAPGGGSLAGRVALTTGASGGALPAAWMGLHGAADFEAYRAAVLDIDWHGRVRTDTSSPVNLLRLYDGGVNNPDDFADALDRDIFHGARLGDFGRKGRPQTVLSATDIANHAPFLFAPATFAQLCADGPALRVADAVAASMAAPVLFRPLTMQSFAGACATPAPGWLKAAADGAAPWTLARQAHVLASYRAPKRLGFVHLLDAGLTDYLAVSALLIARLAAETPIAPLEPGDAVRLTQLTVVLVDVGQAPIDPWPLNRDSPDGQQAIEAAFGAAMGTNVRLAHDALAAALEDWQTALRDWRCGLAREEVRRLRGTLEGWRCAAVTVTLGRVSFDDLPPDERAALAAIKTRLSLARDEVDRLIAGGRAAALASPVLRALSDAQHR